MDEPYYQDPDTEEEFTEKEWLREIDDKIKLDMALYGWSVIAVCGGDHTFAYSVGMSQIEDGYELLAMNVDPRVVTHLMNTFGKRLESGEKFELGEDIADIADNGYQLQLRECPADVHEKYSRAANRYVPGCKVLQLVMPDPLGYFPDDPQCDPDFAKYQHVETDIVSDKVH